MAEKTLEEYTASLRSSLALSRKNCQGLASSLHAFNRHMNFLEMSLEPVEAEAHALVLIHDNAEAAMNKGMQHLKEYDVPRQLENVIKTKAANSLSYFAAIRRLQSTVAFFTVHKSWKGADSVKQHAQRLVSEGLRNAKDHLRVLLSSEPTAMATARSSLVSSCSGSFLLPEAIAQEAHICIRGLKDCGQSQECLKIHKSARCARLLSLAAQAGLSSSKSAIAVMEWTELSGLTRQWKKLFKSLVEQVLPAEKEQTVRIFRQTSLAEEAFWSSVEPLLQAMLDFIRGLCQTKRSPEKLFGMLGCYKSLKASIPQLERLMQGHDELSFVDDVKAAASRLRTASVEVLASFEANVELEDSVQIGDDGRLHPLTSYVLNYLKVLLSFGDCFTDVLHCKDFAKSFVGASTFDAFNLRILDKLRKNLDIKSTILKDPALAHIFMINNCNYILSAVPRFHLLEGSTKPLDLWQSTVEEHCTGYIQETTNAITRALSVRSTEGGKGFFKNRSILRESLTAFERTMEQELRKQAKWIVLNKELRNSLQSRATESILNVYQSWLHTNSTLTSTPEKVLFGSNRERQSFSAKYTTDDLRGFLGQLFTGEVLDEDSMLLMDET